MEIAKTEILYVAIKYLYRIQNPPDLATFIQVSRI